ncbi:MAG: VOC family protein [Saprospiraceae bacterium]|nr:VOC family protein [Saprospiraceae bacterium]MCF8248628.1 VOC family protein [Saprospiraceae bacterium]MCF8278882.1 VOC family protein [Bacteroidales bacterium]MCF8310682.1 VOC family protein [Saprospiraceae bacterium]MCF8439241.1 VOC family protein [Saprospiraceae bacterium]
MKSNKKHFLGLRTVIYANTKLQAARDWYADVLGFPPYFDEPFYVGFNVGGYELGIMPAEGVNQPGGGGVLAYWGVEKAAASFERLISKGATEREPVTEVGGGIKVATVLDPFGNILGVIENPHFKVKK